eukprot:2099834-Rhodomonas_salina.1
MEKAGGGLGSGSERWMRRGSKWMLLWKGGILLVEGNGGDELRGVLIADEVDTLLSAGVSRKKDRSVGVDGNVDGGDGQDLQSWRVGTEVRDVGECRVETRGVIRSGPRHRGRGWV